MPLEKMNARADALHRQLRTFVLPTPLQAEMRSELEELELKMAESEKDRAGLPTSGSVQISQNASGPSIGDLLGIATSDSPLIPVVSKVDLDAFETNNVTGDKDLERRNKTIIKKLRERGEFRDLRKLPSDWQKRLARLEHRFPNFREPIEYLRASLFTSGRRDGSIYWSPLLLDGPPGVGKTMFCEELADAFRLPFARLDMASAQSASALAGSDIFWVNTRPGRVFGEVLLGELASPLFVLDEIEKATGDERYPAVNALYPLLEQRSARRFEDLSFPGIRFDASRVLWVATSNEAKRLEAPILDRMRVFSIPAPGRKAMQRIVQATVDEVLAELRLTRRDLNLGKLALQRLTEMPPRRMKRTIMESVALSALRRRRSLEVAAPSLENGRSRIGFH